MAGKITYKYGFPLPSLITGGYPKWPYSIREKDHQPSTMDFQDGNHGEPDCLAGKSLNSMEVVGKMMKTHEFLFQPATFDDQWRHLAFCTGTHGCTVAHLVLHVSKDIPVGRPKGLRDFFWISSLKYSGP